MKILVKRVGGAAVICTLAEIDPDATTIHQVKLLIEQDILSQTSGKDSFPPDTQRIIFQGKQMDDAATLSLCGMQGHEAMVHVIFRLNGATHKEDPAPTPAKSNKPPDDKKSDSEKIPDKKCAMM